MVDKSMLGSSQFSQKKSYKKRALSSINLSDLDNESAGYESKSSVSNRRSSRRLVASENNGRIQAEVEFINDEVNSPPRDNVSKIPYNFK